MNRQPADLPAPPSPFWRDARGLAAVELALTMPIVIGVLALVAMGGQGFMIDRKLVLATHTVTDLVARTPYLQDSAVPGATQIAPADLSTDLALAAEIIYPESSTKIQLVVAELKVNAANNTGTVQWSVGCFGSAALATNTTIKLDPAYANTGATYLIYGQAVYTFQPLGIIYPTATIPLTSTELLTIRNGSQITTPQGLPASCP